MQVFSAASCIDNYESIQGSAPLWVTIAGVVFLYCILLNLGIVADRASGALFDKLIATHPELRDIASSGVTAESLKVFQSKEQSLRGSNGKSTNGCWVRAAVALMNLSCCPLLQRKESGKRSCFHCCLVRQPTIRVLPFLPDAFAGALYMRFRALLLADMTARIPSPRLNDIGGVLAEGQISDDRGHQGIVRIDAVESKAFVASQAIAEDRLAESVEAVGCCLRMWRFRSLIVHVWGLHVSCKA